MKHLQDLLVTSDGKIKVKFFWISSIIISILLTIILNVVLYFAFS